MTNPTRIAPQRAPLMPAYTLAAKPGTDAQRFASILTNVWQRLPDCAVAVIARCRPYVELVAQLPAPCDVSRRGGSSTPAGAAHHAKLMVHNTHARFT